MGKKVKKFNYDVEKGISTVYLSHKDYPVKVKAVSKVHEEDKDFQSEYTGRQLTEFKAEAAFNEKMSLAKRREAQALRALALKLDMESEDHLQEAENYKEAYFLMVNAKEVLYSKLRENREDGGYKGYSFENLGDLTKELTPDERREIAKQILDGTKGELVNDK